MSSSSASFVAGDTGSKLRVTCKDNDTGLAIDLTGSTVTLRWKDSAGVVVTQQMTVTNAPGGIAEYQFTADQLYAGIMSLDVYVTDSSGNVITSLSKLEELISSPIS